MDNRKNDNLIMETLFGIKEDLGGLKQGQKETNDHLKQLNGSVARHNKEIEELKIAKATPSGLGMLIKGFAWVIGFFIKK